MQKINRFILTLAVLVLTGISAMAQNVNVTGKVTDTSGEPLIAVTVFQDGNTSNGTVTDMDGNYTISVPSSATLVFSCLGFEEVKQAVGKRGTISVTLKEEQLSIDAAEVVSVGYGSVARRDLTGSVAKVDMGSILKTSQPNFDQALAGRVAGVVVSTSDGSLGAEANFTIRGNNSLTQSSAPLFVIDGFPSESSMATAINPNDIESIDVLKDASATAIYGARGANGVIVITTKSGMEGKPKVNFSASLTMHNIYNKVDLMDAYEFVEYQVDRIGVTGGTNSWFANEDMWYRNNGVWQKYAGDPKDPGAPGNFTLEDYKGVKGVDWQDEMYRTALMQNYNISLSGGSKTAGNRYNISFSAVDQQGIIIDSDYQKYQGRINFNQKLGKKIQIDLNVNYSRSITKGTNPTVAQASSSASGWLLYSVWGYRPIVPFKDQAEYESTYNEPFDMRNYLTDNGIDSADDYRFNPLASCKYELRKTVQDYMNANAAFNWQIIEGLKLKISGGYTFDKRRREEFNGSMTYTGYEGSPSGSGINGGIYWNDKVLWLNENTLTWDHRVQRKHNMQLLVGFTLQGQIYDYKGIRATQMTTESLGINGLHTGKYQNIAPWQEDWHQMSFLGRFNYNYLYKYYLTVSFRADGSSKFPVKNRWGYFPSVGASWNFNREDWAKEAKWLNNGKLRFSWGLTGNNRTTTPYDFYAQIMGRPGASNSYDYVWNGQIVPGYAPIDMANPNLKWETTEQWNAGIDFSVLDSRIKVTADWYLKNTRDLLLEATIPASSGYTLSMMNIGSMQNQGVELTLDLVPVRTRNFEWSMNFNIAFNRNKVTGLNSDQYSLLRSVSWDTRFNSQYPYITQVGKPSGLMYGFIYDGLYTDEDFNGAYLKDGVPYLNSVGKASVRKGDPKYRDINEDGIVDDNDRTIIGRGQPIHTGGFGNTFTFHGFDVNIFFSWSYGNDILNANRLIFENGTISNLNQFSSYKDRYDAVKNPDGKQTRIGANGMFVYSSRVVEDGSFLKLRNVSIGYTLPRRVLRRMHFDNLRVHVSADNLLTFTKYSGPDPEVSTRNSVLTPGFDWSAYPRAFGLTAGVTFTF